LVRLLNNNLKNMTMKKTINKILLPALFLATLCLGAVEGKSQERKLPDGSIVYPDGSRRLPNGTVVTKGGTVITRGNKDVRLPGGDVIWREERRDRNDRVERRRETRRGDRKWMPPGQAKKVYGGSARDYAPGQQKKWNKNKHRQYREYEGRNGDHEGRGNHGGKGKKNN
jgi:hypothetical protein